MRVRCPACSSVRCEFRFTLKRYTCVQCAASFTHAESVQAQKIKETPQPVKVEFKGEKAGAQYRPTVREELHRDLRAHQNLAMTVHR